MFILLFQIQEALKIPGYLVAILTIVAGLIGFAVCYVYFRSGIDSKRADGYKGLYEMEVERGDKFEQKFLDELKVSAELRTEVTNISNEYSQLAQLFGKKSIVLEGFTGQYGNIVNAIEQLAREGKLYLPRQLERGFNEGLKNNGHE